MDQWDQDLQSLKHRIADRFTSRQLFKGVSQVIKAIEQRRPVNQVYLVGKLDSHYEKAVMSCIVTSEVNVKIYHLPAQYTRLVYDVIKDLSLSGQRRCRSRRFFKCRAFGL